MLRRRYRLDHESIAAPRQGLYEDRVIGVVFEGMANLADGVTECLRTAVALAPGALEQGFARNQFTRRLREAQQDFGCFGRQVRGTRVSRDLPPQGLDEEIPQVKTLQ